MAFSIEAIDQAFLHDGQYKIDIKSLESLKKGPNYTIVTDYLTGNANRLTSIQLNFELYYFRCLLSLLKNIESPTADDQLILGLFTHPALIQDLASYYIAWLIRYLVAHPTDPVLQAVLHSFQQLGYGPPRVYEHLLIHFEPKAPDYIRKKVGGTVLKEFLSNHLLRSKGYQQPSFSSWVHWNYLYFWLLEENQLDSWATAYVIEVTYAFPSILSFLFTYRDGKYIAAILEHLKKAEAQLPPAFQQRFEVGLALHDINKEVYASLLIEPAKQYLQQVMTGNGLKEWEPTHELEGLKQPGERRYRLSACAVYYLLHNERDWLLQAITGWFGKGKYLTYDAMEVLHWVLGKEALPYLQADLQNDAPVDGVEHYTKLVEQMQRSFEPSDYIPFVWKIVGTKSRPLKILVTDLLIEKDPTAEANAIALLASKQAETRLSAALILQRFSSPTAIAAVHKALQKEMNDNARDMLLPMVAAFLEEGADMATVQQMIGGARERGKLGQLLEPWLEESMLAPLYYKDGTAVSSEATRFLLYRMSRVKTMRSDVEARLLLLQVDKERSGEFAKQLFKLFLDHGAKAELKYLLALVALTGDEEIVDKIRTTINHWLDENRTKMAEYGIGALALQGSDKALRWVEWYSRKFRNKKAVIGATALQALEDAAEELGITIQELGDRIVPDFGFEGLFKHFRIGQDEYRAFVDSKFKVCFFDEDNKALKNLPAAAPAELKEEFKVLGKEIRDVVKSQSLRLENYLVIQRPWTYESWQAFFLQNPVMFIYATKLLWGIYEEGRLVDCFICLEDTTLVNVEEEEIGIAEGAQIRIVHPLHLSEDGLPAWKRKFFDLSIDPIFLQLDRTIYRLPATDVQLTIIHDFAGKEAEPGSIRGTLERFGWRKGQAEDAGSVNHFHYLDHDRQLEAVLEVSGVFVSGFGSDMDPSLGRLYFITAPSKQTGWFNEPKHENDERLIPLGKVPDTLYSEVLAAVHAIKLAGPAR
jgi:hypothetical protein